jgi:hypothetical protein
MAAVRKVKDEQEQPAQPRPPIDLPGTVMQRDYCDICTWKCLARSKAAIADALEEHFRWHIARERHDLSAS